MRLTARPVAAAAVVAAAVLPFGAVAVAAPAGPVLSGRVVDTAGRPVAGAEVTVADDHTKLAVVHDGKVCLVDNPWTGVWSECGRHAVRTVTRSDGSYRVALPAGTPVARRGERSLRVEGRRDWSASGGRTTTTFAHSGRSQQAPTVVLWTGALGVRTAAGRVHLVPRLPAGAHRATEVTLRGADAGSAWQVAVPATGAVDVDARVVEAGSRWAEARAEGRVSGRRVDWWSASSPLAGTAVPASRKLGCAVNVAGGDYEPVVRCPFTDGRLGTELGMLDAMDHVPDDACTWPGKCSVPNALRIDLGGVHLLDAVVLRACDGCTVDYSLDGASWQPRPRERREGARYAVLSGPPLPVRWVRVTGPATMTFRLREVSVWGDPLVR